MVKIVEGKEKSMYSYGKGQSCSNNPLGPSDNGVFAPKEINVVIKLCAKQLVFVKALPTL